MSNNSNLSNNSNTSNNRNNSNNSDTSNNSNTLIIVNVLRIEVNITSFVLSDISSFLHVVNLHPKISAFQKYSY